MTMTCDVPDNDAGTSALRRQLPDVDAVRKFMLAGNATITLVSRRTGTRFTYRIRQAPNAPSIWFVSLLTGSDNQNDYEYIGIIKNWIGGAGFLFSHTGKARISTEAPGFKAFQWATIQLFRESRLPDMLEIWHEGRCGRCGRKLTVPESIERGLGPKCGGE